MGDGLRERIHASWVVDISSTDSLYVISLNDVCHVMVMVVVAVAVAMATTVRMINCGRNSAPLNG